MSVSMVETNAKNFENPAYQAETGEKPAANNMATTTSAPAGTNEVNKHQSLLPSRVH